MKLRLLATGIAALLLQQAPAHAAVVYDLAGQFDTANATNGPWSYGYETSLGATFMAYPDQVTVAGFTGRADPSVPGYSTYSVPADFINTSSSTVTGGTITLAPGQAAFHPGEADELSIYRFTAPSAGTYTLDATFAGADYTSNGSTTVLIADDSDLNPLFSAGITQFAVPVSTGPITLTLTEGETLDFAVEQNGEFSYDTTAVEATISAVPEPASWAMLLLGMGLVGAALRSNRRRPANLPA